MFCSFAIWILLLHPITEQPRFPQAFIQRQILFLRLNPKPHNQSLNSVIDFLWPTCAPGVDSPLPQRITLNLICSITSVFLILYGLHSNQVLNYFLKSHNPTHSQAISYPHLQPFNMPICTYHVGVLLKYWKTYYFQLCFCLLNVLYQF